MASILWNQDRLIATATSQSAAYSRNVFHVLRRHFIDERLISWISALRFFPKLVDHSRIQTTRNKLPRRVHCSRNLIALFLGSF